MQDCLLLATSISGGNLSPENKSEVTIVLIFDPSFFWSNKNTTKQRKNTVKCIPCQNYLHFLVMLLRIKFNFIRFGYLYIAFRWEVYRKHVMKAGRRKSYISKFDVHVTVHRDKFRTIKPTRCINFLILFWNETLLVSVSASVHHQEFFTVHTAMVYVIQVMLTACKQSHSDPACKLSA